MLVNTLINSSSFSQWVKHTPMVTYVLLGMFLAAQFIGLGVVYKYIDPVKSVEAGETIFKDLPIGERPPMDEQTSFIPIIVAIIVGTGMLLLLLTYHLDWIWKSWFFVAVAVSLTVAGSAFMWSWLAGIFAVVVGLWKVFRPNFWVQNMTELFVYGGLAAIFVPLFSLWSVSILLVLIAIYDAYAVWKSKHMVMLAKAQAEAKVFAGLLIPYVAGKVVVSSTTIVSHSSGTKKTAKAAVLRTAILGGGDMGFPLIFAGVVMKELGVWQSLVIPFFALLGLGVLLWFSKEKKFYPAMPFIAAGCFLGWGMVAVIEILI